MLRPIHIQADIFRTKDPLDLDRSRKSVCCLMLGLSLVNVEFLRMMRRKGIKVPRLYDGDVVYRREESTEDWKDIPNILRDGYGDCEDLACFRIAEYQFRGIKALPYVTWRSDGPSRTILHAVLKLPDGRIEDPSRALGMLGPSVYRPVFIESQDIAL